MNLPAAPRQPRRLVYFGTPELAVPPLQALHGGGFDLALVVTRVDKRRGRGGQLTPSPVKVAATAMGIPVSHDPAQAAGVGADLGVVVAYGRIIATDLLAVLPMVNLHFSLLPRWRGAAPVERAILAGDTETGVCLMVVAPELDTGAVYAQRRLAIDPDDTLGGLRSELVAAGTELLIASLTDGLPPPRAQEGEPVYAAKVEPIEHRLRFERPAVELHRVIRLGRAWCEFRGRRLKVLAARPDDGGGDVEVPRGDSAGGSDGVGLATGCAGDAGSGGGRPEGPDGGSDGGGRATGPGTLHGTRVCTGRGDLRLLEVQPEGRRPMTAEAWRNGAQLRPGDVLA